MAFRPDKCVWAAAAALLALTPAAAAPAVGSLAEAVLALRRDDPGAAEAAVRRARGEGARDQDVAALAGEAELLLGNRERARRWLEPGEFSIPTRQRGFHALGRLELVEGDMAAAATAFDRALQEGPGTARLWADIASLRYRTGQHQLAIEAADRALELDQGDPHALKFRGLLVRDSQGLLASLPWFEKALEASPDDLDLLGEYAATLAEAGRHRDMLVVARRMVELDPRHPRAYFLQAVLAARAGHDDLARRLLWRANGAYDRQPAGLLLNGVLDLRGGSAALAVNHFDALVRLQPDNPVATMLLGRAFLAHGEANEVIFRLGPAADRADASPYLLALVGRAYERLDRRDLAAGYLDRAAGTVPGALHILPAQREPFLPAMRTERGGAAAAVPYLRQVLAEGRRSEAARRVVELVREYPGSADVEVLAGDVFLTLGDHERARGLYASAARVRRDFALVERMALIERQQGRDASARSLVADYAAQYPRSAPAAALLGRLVAQEGRWTHAAAWLDHARALGGAGDVRLETDLAAALLMAGDIEGALAPAQRAYALQRSSGRASAVLARVMQASRPADPETLALLAKARTISGSEFPGPR